MKLLQYIATALATVSPLVPFCAYGASISVTTATGGTITATAVTPYIIRVDNTAPGESVAPVQSVLELTPDADCAYTSRQGTRLTTTAGIRAEVVAGMMNICYDGLRNSNIADWGVRTTATGERQLSLYTTSTGSMYGGGERGHRYNLAGDTLVMYNRQNYGYTGTDPRISQMNITMPVVLSSDGFALVFDDYAPATMALGNPIRYTTESTRPVSYYYVAGNTLADLTENLTELTGRQPLPPMWSMGYITSKYGYRDRRETEGAVDTLKTAGYPVDGIVLDLYWYGKEEDMGRLAWDPDQWPDPEGMLAGLKDRGVNLVAISQPYILRNGRGVDNYHELAARGMMLKDSVGAAPQEVTIWVGEGGMFDVSNPDTRRWLSDRYRSLTDMGVTGWWGDLGEPEVHPETGLHANGLTARLYHNKYGNDWSSIISTLFADRYPDRRLMTLMRGGTTGLQRHSVFPWSTDVSRSWGGLEPQVRIMLNSGLSGMGYMSSDLGGFAVDPAEPYMPELYLRWVQMGQFTPVFRTHAQQYAEPYHYPRYADILLGIVRDRYRWLPYNYTLAYENARYGYPLVRPLDFHQPGQGLYDNISDEYLWGSEVLVAPVMTSGTTVRDIVLPDGLWVDYYDAKVTYQGPATVWDYPAPLERLPLFVRAGAFIPQADYEMENTSGYRADRFAVRFFAAGEGSSEYTLYDDNRLTPGNIEAGQYRLIHFSGTRSDAAVSIDVTSAGSYDGAPEVVTLSFRIEGLDRAPRAVDVAGAEGPLMGAFDGKAYIAELKYRPGKKMSINLKR